MGNSRGYPSARTDLSQLSHGEHMLLERLRLGEKQIETAARLGMGQRAYAAAERDRAPVPKGYALGRIRPTLAEQCRLARRRYGRGLRAVAKRLGYSHVTLLGREACGDADLVKSWGKLGFTFT